MPNELETHVIRSMLGPPLLEGNLSGYSLREILNQTKAMPNKKRIRIFNKNGRGCFFLDNEDLIYAEYQGSVSYSGINAISFFMNLKEGYFNVRETFCSPVYTNISGDVDIILSSITYQNERLDSPSLLGSSSLSEISEQNPEKQNPGFDLINIKNKIDKVATVALFSENGRLKDITDNHDEKIMTDLNNIIFKELSKLSSELDFGKLNAFAISTDEAFFALSNKNFDSICIKGEPRVELLSNCSKLSEI
jgi:hypothetical protein